MVGVDTEQLSCFTKFRVQRGKNISNCKKNDTRLTYES